MRTEYWSLCFLDETADRYDIRFVIDRLFQAACDLRRVLGRIHQAAR